MALARPLRPYIDNRPLLVATKPDLRKYEDVNVLSDAEIGLFGDEVRGKLRDVTIPRFWAIINTGRIVSL